MHRSRQTSAFVYTGCVVHHRGHVSHPHSDNICLSTGVSECDKLEVQVSEALSVRTLPESPVVSHMRNACCCTSRLRVTYYVSRRRKIRLYQKRQDHIFTPLALVPNYAQAQSLFCKVYVWLCHAAGVFFTGCFQNHFPHCN